MVLAFKYGPCRRKLFAGLHTHVGHDHIGIYSFFCHDGYHLTPDNCGYHYRCHHSPYCHYHHGNHHYHYCGHHQKSFTERSLKPAL